MAAAILKNPKMRYLGYGLADRHEIWHGGSSTLLTVPTVKNLKFRKYKMAAVVILKNRKIAISQGFELITAANALTTRLPSHTLLHQCVSCSF